MSEGVRGRLSAGRSVPYTAFKMSVRLSGSQAEEAALPREEVCCEVL
jgi:hypothetical protein